MTTSPRDDQLTNLHGSAGDVYPASGLMALKRPVTGSRPRETLTSQRLPRSG